MFGVLRIWNALSTSNKPLSIWEYCHRKNNREKEVIYEVIGCAVIGKVIRSTKFNRYAVLDVQVGVVSTIRQRTDRYVIEE